MVGLGREDTEELEGGDAAAFFAHELAFDEVGATCDTVVNHLEAVGQGGQP